MATLVFCIHQIQLLLQNSNEVISSSLVEQFSGSPLGYPNGTCHNIGGSEYSPKPSVIENTPQL